MKIHYHTYARFVEFFGKEGDFEITPGTTVQGFLELLTGDDEKKQSLLFDVNRVVRRYVIILKNKDRILNEETDSTDLQDGDELIIYPPVSGG